MIWSSRARNRSCAPVFSCLPGRIEALPDALSESRIGPPGNRKTDRQIANFRRLAGTFLHTRLLQRHPNTQRFNGFGVLHDRPSTPIPTPSPISNTYSTVHPHDNTTTL